MAEAQDGAEAVELCGRHLPHVALIDVQMPVLDGIEATRRIAADPGMRGVHVIMHTNYGLDEYVFNALRAGVTPREREVVALVVRGPSNEEIAERMVISPLTAKTHVSRAMGKLDVRDRAQLVVVAYESGQITRRSEG